VLFSIGKCSFDSGRDKACRGFEFAAMQQHAILGCLHATNRLFC
jgi:hypothetical protein